MSRARTLLSPAYLAAVALLIAAAALIAACGGGDDDPGATITISTPGAGTATSTPARTPRPTETPPPDQTVSAEAVASIERLNEFIDQFGYPSDADFARLRIPKLGVDAAVASRFVSRDATMPDPEGPAEVVWYDLSAWSGMGGVPGGGGNAIFSGHVDYNWTVGYAGVNYRGPGVFRELGALQTGDIIEVEYGGTTYRYAVVSRRQINAVTGDWGSVWSNAGGDAITLYTCGGDFDSGTLSYSDRVVVRAERLP